MLRAEISGKHDVTKKRGLMDPETRAMRRSDRLETNPTGWLKLGYLGDHFPVIPLLLFQTVCCVSRAMRDYY